MMVIVTVMMVTDDGDCDCDDGDVVVNDDGDCDCDDGD